MKNVHIVIGTRPEAIKMAPIFKALQQKRGLNIKLISTGQHQELLHQALSSFGLSVDQDLNVMKPGQSLSSLTAQILLKLENHFLQDRPDIILAHGDTTTCYATALSAFYHTIPLFHVEAGLRSHRLDSPYPEEFNRQCVTQMASHHFAPDEDAKRNLHQEGIAPQAISVIGSTVHDAIRLVLKQENEKPLLSLDSRVSEKIRQFKKMVLLTMHRRENLNSSIIETIQALRDVADAHSDVVFTFPVHPNPQVKHVAELILSSAPNVMLLNPLNYPQFLSLMNHADVVCTDSGGVQEEASYFGKKTFILRDITERADGMSQNLVEIIGTKSCEIVAKLSHALSNQAYKRYEVSTSQQPEVSASQIVADVVAEKCFA